MNVNFVLLNFQKNNASNLLLKRCGYEQKVFCIEIKMSARKARIIR